MDLYNIGLAILGNLSPIILRVTHHIECPNCKQTPYNNNYYT
jgi:hypothetical protein